MFATKKNVQSAINALEARLRITDNDVIQKRVEKAVAQWMEKKIAQHVQLAVAMALSPEMTWDERRLYARTRSMFFALPDSEPRYNEGDYTELRGEVANALRKNIGDDAKAAVAAEISGEDFIDGIVERILRKQIGVSQRASD